jgi:hypothetical protein
LLGKLLAPYLEHTKLTQKVAQKYISRILTATNMKKQVSNMETMYEDFSYLEYFYCRCYTSDGLTFPFKAFR